MCVDLACVLVKYKYENKYMQIDYILLFQILWKKIFSHLTQQNVCTKKIVDEK
jgi:hypothetical protein